MRAPFPLAELGADQEQPLGDPDGVARQLDADTGARRKPFALALKDRFDGHTTKSVSASGARTVSGRKLTSASSTASA